MKPKVLMLDSNHSLLTEGLNEAGFEVVEDFNSPAEEVAQSLSDYQGLIIRSRFPLNRDFLSNGKLRFIGRVGAGLENIDLEACEDLNIEVFNAAEGNRDAVGEQAIGMLLSLFNNLKKADSEVRTGIWKREENRGLEIQGKTIGIIGYGNMGSGLAEKLSGFGARVIAYDKYKKGFSSKLVEEVGLKKLQEEADIISLHTPQTEETVHMINELFIEACVKPFYLINTARGSAVKTSALVDGLKKGKVKGACLDVLEYEKSSFQSLFHEQLPEAFDYLTKSEKVILSPHIAGWTHESKVKLAQVILDKIKKWKSDNNG